MAEKNDVLLTELKGLQETVVSKLNAYNEEMKAFGAGQSEIKDSIKAEAEARVAELQKMADRLDGVETMADRFSASEARTATFEDELTKAMEDVKVSSELYKVNKNISMTMKAPITMTQSASLTDQVIPPHRIPGVIFDPDRTQHVRQMLPATSTNSNTVYYVREDFDEDATAMTAEGVTKPLSSFKLVQMAAPVKKIATRGKISTEMLDDIPYLAGHISQRFPQKLSLVEDNQLLYGTGLTVNLEGISEVASAFSAAGIVQAPTGRNRFDVIAWAAQQVTQDEYSGTGAFVNNRDYFNMLLTKDAENRYLVPNLFSGGQIIIAGMPVLWSTAVTAGDFFVGDWRLGAQIVDRKGTEVRFYDQNEDDAIKNLVTVIVEKRLAFPIYRPKAFVHSNFTTALAAT